MANDASRSAASALIILFVDGTSATDASTAVEPI
jgi:hypothetical protein